MVCEEMWSAQADDGAEVSSTRHRERRVSGPLKRSRSVRPPRANGAGAPRELAPREARPRSPRGGGEEVAAAAAREGEWRRACASALVRVGPVEEHRRPRARRAVGHVTGEARKLQSWRNLPKDRALKRKHVYRNISTTAPPACWVSSARLHCPSQSGSGLSLAQQCYRGPPCVSFVA